MLPVQIPTQEELQPQSKQVCQNSGSLVFPGKPLNVFYNYISQHVKYPAILSNLYFILTYLKKVMSIDLTYNFYMNFCVNLSNWNPF